MAYVTKRGDSYLCRISVGYDSTGKQIEKTMTWKPPAGMSEKKALKEAQHQATLFEERARNGLVTDGHIKFADFAEKWFKDYAEVRLRPKTVAGYRSLMDRIDPVFGHLYMDKIRPVHLMDFYKELSETRQESKYLCRIDLEAYLKEHKIKKQDCAQNAGISHTNLQYVFHGKLIQQATAKKIASALNLPMKKLFEEVEGKPLAASTIVKYHRLLSSIMHTAVKWQVIVSNPCDRVDPPKAKKVKIEYLDVEQSILLLDLMENEPIQYRTAVTILLFTGMRRGELLGLEWSDINYQKQLIDISRSSQYLPDRGIYEDGTKNDSSSRVIKVTDSVIKAFKELQSWQMEQHMLMMDVWENSNKVFTTYYGAPMHPDTLTSWFHDFIAEHPELPPIHLHSLRHTNATLSIANGEAVTTVAGQLGHVDATTTTKIYAHSIQSAQAKAADKMEELLRPKKTTKRPPPKRPKKNRPAV